MFIQKVNFSLKTNTGQIMLTISKLVIVLAKIAFGMAEIWCSNILIYTFAFKACFYIFMHFLGIETHDSGNVSYMAYYM